MANANYNHKNLKRFTLSEGINATTTSIPVTAVLDPPDVPFVALIKNKKYPDGVDDPEAEFVLVTVAGASPWTATRGVESTAVSHDIGNYDLVPTTTAALMNALAAIAEVVLYDSGDLNLDSDIIKFRDDDGNGPAKVILGDTGSNITAGNGTPAASEPEGSLLSLIHI